MLLPIASDLLVGLNASPTLDQEKYLPEEILDLPTFGQFYGSKSTLNMEALIEAQPQVVFDLGDKKNTVKKDMEMIQRQTGIPTLFYRGELDYMAETYEKQMESYFGNNYKDKLTEFRDKCYQ